MMGTVVITGANRGIGIELAKNYSQTHSVYALCRVASDALQALQNTTVIEETGFDFR